MDIVCLKRLRYVRVREGDIKRERECARARENERGLFLSEGLSEGGEEHEKERERECVCVRERDRTRERERVRVRERESVCVCERD